MMQANGRDLKVSDQLCANVTRPDAERECVRIDSSGCDTVWEVEKWGEVRSGSKRKGGVVRGVKKWERLGSKAKCTSISLSSAVQRNHKSVALCAGTH